MGGPCGSAPMRHAPARARRWPRPTAPTVVSERHRHRYEVNPRYRRGWRRPAWSARAPRPTAGWWSSSSCPGHPFWVGTQAHPEFKSRPDRPHPLFRELVAAALGPGRGARPAPHRPRRRRLSPPCTYCARGRARSSSGAADPVVWSVADLATPDGEVFERTVVRHPGAVAVVPLHDDRHRAPCPPVPGGGRPDHLDRPPGPCDVDGRAPRDHRSSRAGRRGRSSGRAFGAPRTFDNTPGFCDQCTLIYLATGLVPVKAAPSGDRGALMRIARSHWPASTPSVDQLGTIVDATPSWVWPAWPAVDLPPLRR